MKYNFRQLYNSDLYRYGGEICLYTKLLLWSFRRCQSAQSKGMQQIFRFLFMIIKKRKNIEIYGMASIGPGLYLGHVYGITINASAKIGSNCNIHKGVTIGQENRGARKGTPTIGDNVWIGVNPTIVGKITVGDDVLIAPNSFINCDIPSHSIVYGNPCIIKAKVGATDAYVNNMVSQEFIDKLK